MIHIIFVAVLVQHISFHAKPYLYNYYDDGLMFQAHSIFFFPRYWPTKDRRTFYREREKKNTEESITKRNWNHKVDTTATYTRARAHKHKHRRRRTPSSSSASAHWASSLMTMLTTADPFAVVAFSKKGSKNCRKMSLRQAKTVKSRSFILLLQMFQRIESNIKCTPICVWLPELACFSFWCVRIVRHSILCFVPSPLHSFDYHMNEWIILRLFFVLVLLFTHVFLTQIRSSYKRYEQKKDRPSIISSSFHKQNTTFFC